MKLIKITSQHRNDFCGILKCEHCDVEEKLTTGYNDNYYHDNVIPGMFCKKCGLDRVGKTQEQVVREGSGNVT